MQHRILSTIIAAAFCMVAGAQETCTINGNIADTRMADGTKVKKVTLMRTDEFGHSVEVATAKVKRGSYTFEHTLAKDEPTMQYNITGFGEGKSISLFVEAGVVNIHTAQATLPEQSTVLGTATNDTYAEYQAIRAAEQRRVDEEVATLQAAKGAAWLETADGKSELKRIKAKEAINAKAQMVRFLIDHNASPMTPLEVERTMLPVLSAAYAEQMTKAIAVSLHEHPYYYSLHNAMLSSTLKANGEAHDITLPLYGGEVKHLTDYRGKHVILNFWSSTCDKSAAMMTTMKSVHEVVKKHADQFVIISVALDSDINAWRQAVGSQGIALDGWLHACDGAGTLSPAAKRYKVENTPKIVFIEPDGHVVSLDMEADEIVMRIEQILSGDLYYLNEEK